MDEKKKGAWILHHSAKLEAVTNRADFENIQVAGKAGVLLSALSAADQVTVETGRVEALAKANHISVQLELPMVLDRLKRAQLIDTSPTGVDVLGVSQQDVLRHTSKLFEEQKPTVDEEAVIVLAEQLSTTPLDAAIAAGQISDTFQILKAEAVELIARARDIGFVDGENIDSATQILFNGNLFRREQAKKMRDVLASITSAEQKAVNEVTEYLNQHGCAERGTIENMLTKPVFEKLQAIGVFDVSDVSNSSESVSYVTLPQAFAKFGDPFAEDALDLAKAFVSCLMYGMQRSSHYRGQITMLPALLRKLIKGGEIGPADAIGEDYRILEMKGVVKVRKSGGYCFMLLLKPEIGELALKVLTEGDASSEALTNFPGATITRYQSPEASRSHTRRHQNAPSKKGMRDVLVALRGGKY